MRIQRIEADHDVISFASSRWPNNMDTKMPRKLLRSRHDAGEPCLISYCLIRLQIMRNNQGYGIGCCHAGAS